MSDPIVINEAVARESGIDVDHMKRWYAARRGITIATGKTRRHEGERQCTRCREWKQVGEFEQIQRKDGTLGQRRGRCAECVGQKALKGTPAQKPVELRQCETCAEQKPPMDFIDRWGQARKSCSGCRGLCCKPPYGTTTCPRCDQEVHRQEFRMKAPGQMSKGRPFQSCLACRGA